MPPPLRMVSSSCAESWRVGWWVKHHTMQFSSSIGTKAWPFSALADVQRIAAQIVAMQKRDMNRIDAALQRLQPIAFLRTLRHEAMRRRHGCPLEIRQWRFVGRRPHIDPDHVAALDTVVSRELVFFAESAFDRL